MTRRWPPIMVQELLTGLYLQQCEPGEVTDILLLIVGSLVLLWFAREALYRAQA